MIILVIFDVIGHCSCYLNCVISLGKQAKANFIIFRATIMSRNLNFLKIKASLCHASIEG